LSPAETNNFEIVNIAGTSPAFFEHHLAHRRRPPERAVGL